MMGNMQSRCVRTDAEQALKFHMEHKAHVKCSHSPVEQAGDRRFAISAFQITVSIVFLDYIIIRPHRGIQSVCWTVFSFSSPNIFTTTLPFWNKSQCFCERIHPRVPASFPIFSPVAFERPCQPYFHGDKQVTAAVIVQVLTEKWETVFPQPFHDLLRRRFRGPHGVHLRWD